MIPQQFDRVEKADIESLVANAVAESRTLEYKQQLPSNGDEDKREFLADVSSFANASGGDMLFGVSEKRDADGKPTGVPEAVAGLAGINVDAEVNRLDSIIRDTIDPRIPLVQIRAVEGFEGGPVLLLRVPRSWAAPHMVVFKNLSRFYTRDNRGKRQLDVREIRAAFSLSENLAERLRRFRDDRLAKIVAGETPIIDDAPSKIVLHLVPLTALDPTNRTDVAQLASEKSQFFWPMSTNGMSHRFNFDGSLFYAETRQAKTHTYVQLFQQGAIEAVEAVTLSNKRKIIPSPRLEETLTEGLRKYLAALHELGLQPPIFVMLTLLGVEGFHTGQDEASDLYRTPVIDRDILVLPESIVESYTVDAAKILRPAFDAIWRAAGRAFCIHYDKDGNWTPRR